MNNRIFGVSELVRRLFMTIYFSFCIFPQALHLPPSSGYQLFKPFSLGKLNISSSLSRSGVLSQLEDLWRRAIEEKLDIPGRDFKVG